jgi:hypothetical protein
MTVRCKNNLCSIVQVRAQSAEPPQRRPIRRARPPRQGRRRRRANRDRGWPSRTRQRGRDPRNSTTRPPGVEERRRVEEQEEEQDHRKDPGFARPITSLQLVRTVSVFCASISRGQLSPPGTGGRGPIAVGGEIGRLGPGAPGSQFKSMRRHIRRHHQSNAYPHVDVPTDA